MSGVDDEDGDAEKNKKLKAENVWNAVKVYRFYVTLIFYILYILKKLYTINYIYFFTAFRIIN